MLVVNEKGKKPSGSCCQCNFVIAHANKRQPVCRKPPLGQLAKKKNVVKCFKCHDLGVGGALDCLLDFERKLSFFDQMLF